MDRAEIERRWAWLQQFASRYGLAVLCVAGPLIFGSVAPDLALRYLMPGTPRTLVALLPGAPPDAIASRFDFRPDVSAKSDRAAATSGAAAKDAGAESTDEIVARDRNILFGARDIGGRVRYVVASAFLCAVSIAAFGYAAAVVVRRRGWLPLWGPWAVFGGFAVLSIWLALNSAGFERIRPLIVESILEAADAKQAWHTASRALVLVRINTWVALVAVGALLTALYTVSLRYPDRKPDREELLRRREVAHWVLGFGSAILVISVFASEILVDWPASLLAKSQQAALKPMGDALTLLLGAMGTIALFAAMAPALAAFMLDVHRYRAQPAGPEPADDGLGFAPLPVVTAVVAAFAPLLASSLLQLLKGLLP
jgi:hypothetical protein